MLEYRGILERLRRGRSEVAGRYQGRHVLRDMGIGERRIEVFWQHAGWFWRRVDRPNQGDPVGPFTTSTEAYESAKAALNSRS